MAKSGSSGRPRSETSRRAIISSTVSLIETVGYEKLKIVDIAREAGVGKQTIYRWWASKAELVIEAVTEDAKEYVAIPDTGSLKGDLRELVRASCSRVSTDASKNMLSGLLMAGRKDASTLKLFREQFIESRRTVLRDLFTKHSGSGEFKKDINLELIIDLIFGPMWYRLLMETAPLDEQFADELVEHIVQLVSK